MEVYCPHCGNELLEDASFCASCGKPMEIEESTDTEEAASSQTPPPSQGQTDDQPVSLEQGLPCPRCGSRNTKYVAQTAMNTQGGGYSCCVGGCGGLMLGPVGLLLGLCGSGQKTTTTDTSRWVCGDCGAEFVSRGKVAQSIRFLGNIGTGLDIFGMLFIGFTFDWLLGGLVVLCGAFCLWAAFFKGNPNYTTESLFEDYEEWKRKLLIAHGIGLAASLALGFALLRL